MTASEAKEYWEGHKSKLTRENIFAMEETIQKEFPRAELHYHGDYFIVSTPTSKYNTFMEVKTYYSYVPALLMIVKHLMDNDRPADIEVKESKFLEEQVNV